MKSISVFFTLLLLFIPISSWGQKKINASAANYGLSGEAELLSHFIVRGLSYSDNGPAMNASFLAHFGSQFRLGFWGSNVSHLTAADDNFWLKIFGHLNIDLSQRLNLEIKLQDDHFYKSNERNGQQLALDFTYLGTNEFGLQWITNYEGTHTSAEYFWGGKLYDYKKVFKYGAYVGYTNTHSAGYSGYFDFKGVVLYSLNNTSALHAGATLNSNLSQFGIRDDPSVYFGIKLIY